MHLPRITEVIWSPARMVWTNVTWKLWQTPLSSTYNHPGGESMRKRNTIPLFILAAAITAVAGSKIEGTTALKDFQPTGTTDKKTHKNQQYDLSFVAGGKQYTCRSVEKESLKATDFVVGSDVQYEINGDKGKVKNASGKKVECTVMRVAELPAGTAPSTAPPASPK
jgi:hypothetical protein